MGVFQVFKIVHMAPNCAKHILKSYKSGYFTTYTTLRELSGLKTVFGNSKPFKSDEKGFYFTLKARFVFKIFKFLS